MNPWLLQRLKTELAIILQNCVSQLGPLPYEHEGRAIKKILNEQDDVALLALMFGLEICEKTKSWELIKKVISGIEKGQSIE